MSFKLAGVSLIVTGVAVGGAYQLGRNQGESRALAQAQGQAVAPGAPHGTAAGSPAQGRAGPLPTGAVLPASHPPVAGDAHSSDAAGAAQTAGKVDVDRSKKFTHFRVGNKNVKRIFADGNVVWVGTSGGVIRYDTTTDDFRLYDVRSGLLSNGVFFVGRLKDRLVLGTYGGGMSLLDEKSQKWENYNVPEGLGDAFVYDVMQAKSGDVWIATWSGVNRVHGGDLKDRKKWDLHTVESTRKGLPNDWVYGLAEGRNGEIWLATEGGLARWKDGTWRNWDHSKGLGAPYEKVKNDIQFKTDPSRYSTHHAKQKEEMGLQNVDVAYNPNYIVSIAVDKAGVVWAGTWGGGLARFDGKAFRNYTVADGLPGNHVFMLHVDARGSLWAGTNNGLARLDDGKFTVMSTQDGLFANTVFSMASMAGSIWVGSYGGVAQIRNVN